MSFWNWLTAQFDHMGGGHGTCTPPHTDINPASGLPMAGGVDIMGNPFGTNAHNHSGYLSSHDSWSSSTPSHHNSSSGLPRDW